MTTAPRSTHHESQTTTHAIRNTRRYTLNALRNCTFTFVESPLQIHLFLCKTKPIYWIPKMNVTSAKTKGYEKNCDFALRQSKPNSNPIKPNLRKAKMSVTSVKTKDYGNEPRLWRRQNKPNSNPIKPNRKLNRPRFWPKNPFSYQPTLTSFNTAVGFLYSLRGHQGPLFQLTG